MELPGPPHVIRPVPAQIDSGSPLPADRQLLPALRAAWESIAMPLMFVDQDTRVLIANPAARRGLAEVGVTMGDQLGSERLTLLHLDGVTPVAREAQPLVRAFTGSVVEEEYLLRVEGGESLRRCRLSAQPVTGVQGEEPMVLLALRDVTAGGDGASGWRDAVERWSQLVGAASDYAVFMLDADGRMATWSTSARRLLGGTEAEVLGHPLERFFTLADRDRGVPASLLDLARACGHADLEGIRLAASGREFWARGVLTAARGERSELLGFVCVMHDITAEYRSQQEVTALNHQLTDLNEALECRIHERTEELRRKADELAISNRELEAFSYSVSHDLRAPLRAVSGFARMLEEDRKEVLGAEGLHYLERIEDSVREMSQLIDGLLAFSRLLREPLAKELLDMNAMVTDAWQMVQAPEYRTRLEVADLPPARGDHRLMLRVWQNLLENAAKFSQKVPDPLVEVSARTDDGVDWFCVSDNGAGFDMHFAGKLFQPFQRLHRADDFAGNGIGLALVDRIVRRHGGSIQVTAQEGKGARFCFSLDDSAGDGTSQAANR